VFGFYDPVRCLGCLWLALPYTRFVPLSIRANRAKFGFYTIQKLFKEFSVQKTSFYTIMGNLQCKNRDRKFRSVGGSGIPLPPTDHFSATSLKILFARIDRGSDRVCIVLLLFQRKSNLNKVEFRFDFGKSRVLIFKTQPSQNIDTVQHSKLFARIWRPLLLRTPSQKPSFVKP
jgi:hypothetical protein